MSDGVWGASSNISLSSSSPSLFPSISPSSILLCSSMGTVGSGGGGLSITSIIMMGTWGFEISFDGGSTVEVRVSGVEGKGKIYKLAAWSVFSESIPWATSSTVLSAESSPWIEVAWELCCESERGSWCWASLMRSSRGASTTTCWIFKWGNLWGEGRGRPSRSGESDRSSVTASSKREGVWGGWVLSNPPTSPTISPSSILASPINWGNWQTWEES